MKKIFLVLMFMMVAIMSIDAHRNRQAYVTISMQTFYDELTPYGDWLYAPDYGYVWRPYFDNPEAFRPYSSNGDWVYTEYGWTWISDYRWGWAPFHYGRWYFDDYLGWMWIPGYEWAPAWVSWGSYNDYWGWAPLGPNVNVNVNFNWTAPDPWWTFVPCRHFNSGHWRDYIYDRPVHVANITNITNIYIDNNERNNNSWFRGPRVNDVERHINSRVRQMQVVQSERPDNVRVSSDRVSIYNPRVEKNRDSYRPVEYRNVENIRGSNRIQQQNARTNDPGMNRTRDYRDENRSGRQVDYERNSSEPMVQPSGNIPANGRINNNKEENRSSGTRNSAVKSENKPARQNEPEKENINLKKAKQESQRKSESGNISPRTTNQRSDSNQSQEVKKVQSKNTNESVPGRGSKQNTVEKKPQKNGNNEVKIEKSKKERSSRNTTGSNSGK